VTIDRDACDAWDTQVRAVQVVVWGRMETDVKRVRAARVRDAIVTCKQVWFINWRTIVPQSFN